MRWTTEEIGLELPESIELFATFGRDFDRFSFPGPVHRITGGHGGEALLICGSRRTALIDCGMAYCGPTTAENGRRKLAELGRDLDYILLSHSHYDHIGALPYLRKAFPKARVLASSHTAHILSRPGARQLMRQLGEEARELYAPGSGVEIITEGLRVDRVLTDGEEISLGEESIRALWTPGHTDCSMSYLLLPQRLLFTSESTGILEGRDYVHTPCLKSFVQSLTIALPRCREALPLHLCLPHFGMLPDEFAEKYWSMFEAECKSKSRFVGDMLSRGLAEEEMLAAYLDRYWTPAKAAEQPREAFELNSGFILKTLIREREELAEYFAGRTDGDEQKPPAGG